MPEDNPPPPNKADSENGGTDILRVKHTGSRTQFDISDKATNRLMGIILWRMFQFIALGAIGVHQFLPSEPRDQGDGVNRRQIEALNSIVTTLRHDVDVLTIDVRVLTQEVNDLREMGPRATGRRLTVPGD